MLTDLIYRYHANSFDYLELCQKRLEENIALVDIEMSSATAMAMIRGARVTTIDKIGILGKKRLC